VFTVKTPYDGQRNCPKHAEFYSKNKLEKLVHLVGFITRRLCFRSCSVHYCSSFRSWHSPMSESVTTHVVRGWWSYQV